jgi:hypothetical protein
MKSAPLLLGEQAGLVLVGHGYGSTPNRDLLHVVSDLANTAEDPEPTQQTAER